MTLRIDPKVLAAYRAKGEGWQTLMNKVLSAAIDPSGDVVCLADGKPTKEAATTGEKRNDRRKALSGPNTGKTAKGK